MILSFDLNQFIQTLKKNYSKTQQSIATKNAEQIALQKFAGAVGVGAGSSGKGPSRSTHISSSSGGGNTFDNLDLFDAKEQVRLGLKSL